jgi:hypothetical protein
MHGTLPPCNGCRAASMSQVRGHLNPSRTGTHGGYPAFVRQCSRCKDDFIDEETYNSHKTANSCAFQSQSRLQIQIPWARQYLKLFPNATRVPLPCKFSPTVHRAHPTNCRCYRARRGRLASGLYNDAVSHA